MDKEKKELIFLSKDVVNKLYSKKILKRNYDQPGTFLVDPDKVVICIEEELTLTPVKIVDKDTTKEWIEEWRQLFPKGKNENTGMSYRGDRPACLKNMVKFRKEYDYTKEEIFRVTEKALEEARNNDYLYFPAAHYFIHKQHTGSRLAQLCEIYKDGGDDARRSRRTAL